MRQEDYLDHLLEQHDSQAHRHSMSNPEITAILAVVARLTRLREIDVPAAFPRRLEGSLRLHSRVQQDGKNTGES